MTTTPFVRMNDSTRFTLILDDGVTANFGFSSGDGGLGCHTASLAILHVTDNRPALTLISSNSPAYLGEIRRRNRFRAELPPLIMDALCMHAKGRARSHYFLSTNGNLYRAYLQTHGNIFYSADIIEIIRDYCAMDEKKYGRAGFVGPSDNMAHQGAAHSISLVWIPPHVTKAVILPATKHTYKDMLPEPAILPELSPVSVV